MQQLRNITETVFDLIEFMKNNEKALGKEATNAIVDDLVEIQNYLIKPD